MPDLELPQRRPQHLLPLHQRHLQFHLAPHRVPPHPRLLQHRRAEPKVHRVEPNALGKVEIGPGRGGNDDEDERIISNYNAAWEEANL